jgi:hypothetical protein
MPLAAQPIRTAAVAALAVFVLLVAALHVLIPSLAPARYTISEYVKTGAGWIMVLAFVAWATALALTAVHISRTGAAIRHPRVVAGLLALSSTGVLLAAAFPTQAVGGVVPEGVALTMTGRLHDVGSGLVTLAIFAAAATVGVAHGARSKLERISIGLVVFALVVQVSLLAVGPEVGGIRQRLLVLAACAWQAALLRMTAPDQSSRH